MTPKQKRDQKRANEQALRDLDWLTSDARGRRILFQLWQKGGVLDGAASLDAAVLAFREGQRGLVQPIFAVVASNWPERLTAALQENSQGAASSDDRASIDRDDGSDDAFTGDD